MELEPEGPDIAEEGVKKINIPELHGDGDIAFLFDPAREPGPGTAEETLRWADADIKALRTHGKQQFGEDFGLRLHDALQKGLCMRSDYSGAGSAEEAMRRICLASSDLHGGKTPSDVFASLRACDLKRACRKILHNHSGYSKPMCIQKNILDRTPAKVLTKIKKFQAKHLKNARFSATKDGVKRAEVFTKHGRLFMHAAMRLLEKAKLPKNGLKAYCEVHEQDCSVFPTDESKPGAMYCSIAGHNCYDWSTMGAMLLWLGEGALPFLQWVLCGQKPVWDSIH